MSTANIVPAAAIAWPWTISSAIGYQDFTYYTYPTNWEWFIPQPTVAEGAPGIGATVFVSKIAWLWKMVRPAPTVSYPPPRGAGYIYDTPGVSSLTATGAGGTLVAVGPDGTVTVDEDRGDLVHTHNAGTVTRTNNTGTISR